MIRLLLILHSLIAVAQQNPFSLLIILQHQGQVISGPGILMIRPVVLQIQQLLKIQVIHLADRELTMLLSPL